MKQLGGIHHVTAITSSAEKIYHFFTYILGVRLVKKTVNQDDIHTYHLFFADDEGNAGTDMTFFDFQGIDRALKGSDEISKTSFRVPSDQALIYWKKRFEQYAVTHQDITVRFGIQTLAFEDFDGQEYVLFSDAHDQGVPPGKPWHLGPVPDPYAIVGLGPIFLRAKDLNRIDDTLRTYLFFKQVAIEKPFYLYETGPGGNGASVIVEHQPNLPTGRQGYGGIHHVAFRIDDQDALNQWIDHFNTIGARHSGFVDRFYFKSLYTRLYSGMLFEFATEGPGFIDDEEPYETLGELLALPPKLRTMREKIEKMVRPIDTTRSNKTFKKEYLGMEKSDVK